MPSNAVYRSSFILQLLKCPKVDVGISHLGIIFHFSSKPVLLPTCVTKILKHTWKRIKPINSLYMKLTKGQNCFILCDQSKIRTDLSILESKLMRLLYKNSKSIQDSLLTWTIQSQLIDNSVRKGLDVLENLLYITWTL
jgi:hypothetical protein